jgi:hypothetical protein
MSSYILCLLPIMFLFDSTTANNDMITFFSFRLARQVGLSDKEGRDCKLEGMANVIGSSKCHFDKFNCQAKSHNLAFGASCFATIKNACERIVKVGCTRHGNHCFLVKIVVASNLLTIYKNSLLPFPKID